MRGQIVYIEGREDSEKQAKKAFDSFTKYGWDVKMHPGITPETLNEEDFPYPNVKNGRLDGISKNEPHKYKIKKSCLFNNLKFCEAVIDAKQPMAFIEHDAVCIAPYQPTPFDEFLFLTFEYCFKPPTVLANHPHLRKYSHIPFPGVHDFPADFPLKYYKYTLYQDQIMSPGTAAYCLTPKGARKLLYAAEKWGLEQSDFHINSLNVHMEFAFPSPVRYNKVNLNTSHGK